MASEIGEKILVHLETTSPVDTLKLSELWLEDHQKIVGAVKSLQSLGDVSRPFVYFSLILHLKKTFTCFFYYYLH